MWATTLTLDYERLKNFETRMIQTHKAFLDAYLQEEKQVEEGLQAFYRYLDKHIARIGNKCETLKAIEDFPELSPKLSPLFLASCELDVIPTSLSLYNLPKGATVELITYIDKVTTAHKKIVADVDHINYALRQLHHKVQEAAHYLDLIEDLLSKDFTPMRFVRDKLGNAYILAALVHNKTSIKLGLYATRTGTRLLDYLHASIRTADTILLEDIWVDEYEQNKDHGSLLLTTLLTMGKRKNFTRVIGRLTEKDADHFDVLEHFFKKHGFKVTFKSQTAGTIQRFLHKPLYFNH